MSNPELSILHMILKDRCWKEALASGLRVEHFALPEAKAGFLYLLNESKNQKTGHSLPTMEQFLRRHPAFLPEPIPDGVTIAGLVSNLIELSLQRETDTVLFNLQSKKLKTLDDLKTTISKIREVVSRHDVLDYTHSGSDSCIEMVSKWYQEGTVKKITGIPYPWEAINSETRGIQPHDFILFYGRPKNGKTWQLLRLVTHLHDHTQKPILFVSYEMDLQRLMNRLACITARVNYGRFNKSDLSASELGRVNQALHNLRIAKKEGRGIYFAGPAIRGAGRKGFSLLDVEQAAEDIKPAAICIDGLLHATDARTGKKTRDWNIVSNISSDTKQLALAMHVPVICTHQANREGEKEPKINSQSDIAYADALAQDCDLTIRVTLVRSGDGSRKVVLQPEGAREFELLALVTGGDFCENMHESSVIATQSELKKLLSRTDDRMQGKTLDDTLKEAATNGLAGMYSRVQGQRSGDVQ